MISSSRQKVAYGLDGFRLGGVNDVSGTKSPGRVKSFRLDVDDDDPRSSCDARSTNGIESNPSSTEYHHGVASADVRCVQDRASACYNAAAEERSLGERKLPG